MYKVTTRLLKKAMQGDRFAGLGSVSEVSPEAIFNGPIHFRRSNYPHAFVCVVHCVAQRMRGDRDRMGLRLWTLSETGI
jgi:hypothetical protein